MKNAGARIVRVLDRLAETDGPDAGEGFYFAPPIDGDVDVTAIRSRFPSEWGEWMKFADWYHESRRELMTAVPRAEQLVSKHLDVIDTDSQGVPALMRPSSMIIRAMQRLREALPNPDGYGDRPPVECRDEIEDATSGVWNGVMELDVLIARGAESITSPRRKAADPKRDWVSEVLGLIFGSGRDWSVTELAKAVGVKRQTLYKNERVKQALKARRAPGGAIAEGSPDGERRVDLD